MRSIHSLLLVVASTFFAARGAAQEIELTPAPKEKIPAFDWTSEAFTLKSKLLGDTLRIFIARPPSFAHAQNSYPVVLLLDGQYYFAEALSDVAALVDAGEIPEVLLVGIESKDRRRDFTPREIDLPDVGDRARADTYLDFLEHELLPTLETNQRASRPRILVGHSHAGILALHALATRPAVFPWVLDLDTPVHLEHGFLGLSLEETLRAPATPPVRLVSFKSVFGWPEERWTALTACARAGDVLQQNSIKDESHETLVFPAIYRGLKQLFADYSTIGAKGLSALEIDERYRKLALAYGLALVPPEPLMRRTVEELLMEGYGKRAGDWLERYTQAYGAPSDHESLAQQVAAATALGEPTETVAGLLALPRATPEEMKNFLGTWSGTTWMNEGRRSGTSVRFWVEAGVVRGEMKNEEGPLMNIEYLRLRADGALEFGFMNGMSPRGLLVYMEGVPGGPLEGEMHFRGIRFTLPPGEPKPPTVHFELAHTPAKAN